MNTHKNARLTLAGRRALVHAVAGGEPPAAAAARLGISRQTVAKWVDRYREGGEAALVDRSSRPHRCRTIPRYQRRQIIRSRRQGWSSLRIAQHFAIPLSTVVTVQRREGLARCPRRSPRPPIVRYEKAHPGELVHVDVKKLGRIGQVGHRIHGDRRRATRGIGWEYVHIAIDDCTRVSYAEVLPSEQTEPTLGFFQRAAAWFATLGIRVQSWMTDNGSAYRSHAFAALCAREAWGHIRTRPYTPRTNGKAERFIRTLINEWAYGRPYAHSRQRIAALTPYLRYYNHDRRHTALNYTTPLARLASRT